MTLTVVSFVVSCCNWQSKTHNVNIHLIFKICKLCKMNPKMKQNCFNQLFLNITQCCSYLNSHWHRLQRRPDSLLTVNMYNFSSKTKERYIGCSRQWGFMKHVSELASVSINGTKYTIWTIHQIHYYWNNADIKKLLRGKFRNDQ